jgi:hypothetical protein
MISWPIFPFELPFAFPVVASLLRATTVAVQVAQILEFAVDSSTWRPSQGQKGWRQVCRINAKSNSYSR